MDGSLGRQGLEHTCQGFLIVDKTSQNLAGGYELRRKDWAEVTQRFPTFSPEYWDSLTVYIVCRVSLRQTHGFNVSHRKTFPTRTAP